MEVELLGATGGRPAVELISAVDGEKLPLPLGVDDSYAFDHALARDRWIAVQVGYQVVGVRDGNLLRTTRLPDAWRVLPAADPRLAVIDRYFGRSREPDEDAAFELVDSDGVTLKSVTAPVHGAVGELRTGSLVTSDGLLSWDGSRKPLPFNSGPSALLGGRQVLTADGDGIHLIDLETSTEAACPLPSGGGWMLLSPVYDTPATVVAFNQWNYPEVLVATIDLGPQWIDVGFAQHSAAWLDGRRLLLVGDRVSCVVDVESGERRPLAHLPRRAYPRLAVTGRFDREQLRSALRPPWDGPISTSRRDDLIRESQERIRLAAQEVGLPSQALDDARAALRLRSCLRPKRVRVGASRLGGRPDLPPGHRWPSRDGRPMAFLGQLRLDEVAAALPEERLPDDGLLVLFADVDPESGFAASAHVEVVPTAALKRLTWPAALPDELQYEPSIAVVEPTVSVPDWPSLEQYASSETVRDFFEVIGTPGPDHRLFGHPSTIQGHGAPEGCELLLQFDGDALTGASFADGGRLHIWCPLKAEWSGVIDGCEVELDSY